MQLDSGLASSWIKAERSEQSTTFSLFSVILHNKALNGKLAFSDDFSASIYTELAVLYM